MLMDDAKFSIHSRAFRWGPFDAMRRTLHGSQHLHDLLAAREHDSKARRVAQQRPREDDTEFGAHFEP